MYVADFESEGKCVVQVDNGTTDNLFLYRHMPDMEPSSYDKLDFGCHQRVFDLDVPAGMMIRIISKTKVKAAKMALWPQSGGGSGESAPAPDLSGYAKKEELAKLVVSEITNGDAGKALVFNEADGGGAKFEDAEYDSFSGVNDGKTGNGARALMYVRKKGTSEGPKMFLTKDKAYYTKRTDYAIEDGGEIAVKKDLEPLATKKELESKVDTSSLPSKLPNPEKLTIKYNGVQAFEYDGSKAETGNFTVNAETVPMSDSDGTFISAKIADLEARIQVLEAKHVEP